MEPQKRKNQSPLRVIVNGWGILLSAVMLALGFAIGLFGALYLAPELLGFDITATHLAEQAILLGATESDVNNRELSARDTATAFVRDSLATNVALYNTIELLNQTATQSLNNVIATQTAIAIADTRIRTQIALDFQATQAQIQQEATDADIRYRNTQAALGVVNATAESQIVASATASPTATFLPPPTNTPTATPAQLLLDLTQGIPASWTISDEADWSKNERGVLALKDGAWFLLDVPFGGDYTFNITLAPALVVSADYDILLNAQESGGLVLRIHGEALSATDIRLYRYQGTFAGVPAIADMTPLADMRANAVLQNPTRLSVMVRGERLTLLIDDQEIFSTRLSATEAQGQLGIQFPAGALVQQIETRP